MKEEANTCLRSPASSPLMYGILPFLFIQFPSQLQITNHLTSSMANSELFCRPPFWVMRHTCARPQKFCLHDSFEAILHPEDVENFGHIYSPKTKLDSRVLQLILRLELDFRPHITEARICAWVSVLCKALCVPWWIRGVCVWELMSMYIVVWGNVIFNVWVDVCLLNSAKVSVQCVILHTCMTKCWACINACAWWEYLMCKCTCLSVYKCVSMSVSTGVYENVWIYESV